MEKTVFFCIRKNEFYLKLIVYYPKEQKVVISGKEFQLTPELREKIF